ncbi:flagellar M-ring protein FliF [bacterium]|nr:flagellar M-ring protein FliF [bacterium]
MWESLVKIANEANDQWRELSFGKKLGISSLAVLTITCLVALGVWVGEKSYEPLYTDLQPDQSIQLVKILQGENIPYMVSPDGAEISIPPEFIQPTLMKLAIKGVPGGNKPGMELFDKESFGTSSYVQRINYVRAMQGELTRTISTIKSIKKSTVHISMPPKSNFFEKTEDPKASVVVDMQLGKVLTQTEIQGVQNLVAFAVEGLRPERVTVVNSNGVALSRNGDAQSLMSTTMLERQKTIERDFESKIEDIVGRIVGRDNVVARVNAELDFDPLQEEEKLVDPEQVAATEKNIVEDSVQADRSAGGVAGAEGALPGPASTNPATATQRISKNRDRSSYEVSTKIRRKEKALGAIKRLTVAVLVDGGTKGQNGENGEEIRAPASITAETRASIENLVKDTIGFVPDRDSVTIENSQFAREDFEEADKMLAQQERRHLLYSLIRYGTVALIVLVFFMMVVRPFVRWVTGMSVEKVETVLPRTVEELEEMTDPSTSALPGLANLPMLDDNIDLEKAESELLKQKVTSMIEMAPAKAAQILSDWIAISEAAEAKKK